VTVKRNKTDKAMTNKKRTKGQTMLSVMKKEPGSAYDKWNISLVICDTDIP